MLTRSPSETMSCAGDVLTGQGLDVMEVKHERDKEARTQPMVKVGR